MAKPKITETVSTATSATVYSSNGGHVRTYSLEIHGAKFVELAKEMLAQHNGGRLEVH